MKKIKINCTLNTYSGFANLCFENSDATFRDICEAAGVPMSTIVLEAIASAANMLREGMGSDFEAKANESFCTNLKGKGLRDDFSTDRASELLVHARKVRRFVRTLIEAAKEAHEVDSDKITTDFVADEFPMTI